MSNDLQTAAYDQLVRRVGGLLGGGSKVTETLSEVFPVLELEGGPVELKFLRGWRLGMGSATNAAVAANFLLFQIFNPVGSGQIIVPTRMDIWSASAQDVGYAATDVALATSVTNEEQRDTRIGVSEATVGQLRTAAQVGAPTASGRLTLVADTVFTLTDLDGVFVLAPGTGVTFFTTVLNTDFNMSFLWRERQALDSELNFP